MRNHSREYNSSKKIKSSQQYPPSVMQPQPQLNQIKSRQLLGTIMDTIQQKSNYNNQHSSFSQLKQSMHNFDKQLMKIYVNHNNNGMNGKWVEGRSLQNSVHYDNGDGWGRSMNNRNNNDKRYSTIRQKEDVNYHHRPLSAQKYPSNNNNNNQTNNKMNKNNNSSSMKKLLVPSHSVHKLQLPQPNSLTDQFLQRVLGSQQGLIDEYDRCVNPHKYEHEQKQQMIERIKNQWRSGCNNRNFNSSNNYNNSNNISILMSTLNSQNSSSNDYNNLSSFRNNLFNNPHLIGQATGFSSSKGGAFYDEEHYNYLRTNIKYLTEIGQQKRGNYNISNNNNKKVMQEFKNSVNNSLHNSIIMDHNNSTNQSTDDTNHNNNPYNYNNQTLSSPYSNPTRIVAKIQQTGGIQNTIKKMQKSLKKNELKHLKNNQYLTQKPNPILIPPSVPMQCCSPINASKSSTFYNNNSKTNIIINSKLQSPKYSHNYNQLSTTIKKQKIRKNKIQIPQDNNIEAPSSSPMSRPSWRDRSKSLRNKIQQSINSNR